MKLLRPSAAVAEPDHPLFPPQGRVTGIGSLPGTDPRAAVRFVAEASPAVPFWPQLPQRCEREGVIEQGLAGIEDLLERRWSAYGYEVRSGRLGELEARLQTGDPRLDEDHAAGFFAFEKALAVGDFRRAVAVKGQVEGPITLAFYLLDRGRPLVHDVGFLDACARHVANLALWQIERLRPAGLPVLLFIDEPALSLAKAVGVAEDQLASVLRHLLTSLRAAGAVAGLHCCAGLPFPLMLQANPDVLSFDAHAGLEQFCANRGARAFIRDGGQVAFGLVPTWSRLDGLTAESLFFRWLDAASAAGDLRQLARHSLVTATCGLGLLDHTAARAAFDIAHGLACLLERVALVPAPPERPVAADQNELTESARRQRRAPPYRRL